MCLISSLSKHFVSLKVKAFDFQEQFGGPSFQAAPLDYFTFVYGSVVITRDLQSRQHLPLDTKYFKDPRDNYYMMVKLLTWR